MCSHLVLPCCAYVRQAHTNEVTGILSFWPTFWLYVVTGVCCHIGPCVLTTYFRMRLKDRMGIDDHPINDLCCAWFCSPCAIGQQAMAVDKRLGYQVYQFCELEWLEETVNVYHDSRDDEWRSSN